MSTLTERYIQTAVRTLPADVGNDLRTELATSIADAIDARIDAGESPLAAERAVLTDLGDPERLAAAYTDRPLQLIGPRYYLQWRRVTVTLLAIVPAIVGVVVLAASVLAGDSVLDIVTQALTTVLMAGASVAFWTTAGFALAERAGRGASESAKPWSVDELPQIRDDEASLGQLIGSLVVLGLSAIAVGWDHTIGFVRIDGQSIPILDPDLWPWWIAILFAVMILEAVVDIALFRARHWTGSLAIANAVVAVVFAAIVLWLLAEDRLLNPDLLDAAIAPLSPTIAGTIDSIIAIGIVLLTLLEVGGPFATLLRRGTVVSR